MLYSIHACIYSQNLATSHLATKLKFLSILFNGYRLCLISQEFWKLSVPINIIELETGIRVKWVKSPPTYQNSIGKLITVIANQLSFQLSATAPGKAVENDLKSLACYTHNEVLDGALVPDIGLGQPGQL